ncbi:chemotaxis protein CheR [candidate division KSB1 bacterium]|nr:MAG: chemotaxis protein CheR [candidate division KSB1 bacterium]
MSRHTDDTLVTRASIQLTEHDFKKIRDTVHELAGINLSDGKRELVIARLSKRIRQLNMKSVGEYLNYVREEHTQRELVTMLDALSTNLTSFWRESQHFDYLAKHTLPKIIERARQSGDTKIRVWSAGCSSGEEPYSLAMVTMFTLDKPDRYDFKVLATDLSTKVLSLAREGVYSAERVKPIPSEIRHKYILEEKTSFGKQYRVTSDVRSRVTFGRLNLMESWPMRGPMDFIFCRNVMIYFDKPTQARLVRRYHDLLRPGGTLFIGHSESLTGIEHSFRYIRPTIYERA